MPFEYSNKTHSKYTDVFRTLSDIYDSLLQKQLTAESGYLFSQKHSILDIWDGSEFVSKLLIQITSYKINIATIIWEPR